MKFSLLLKKKQNTKKSRSSYVKLSLAILTLCSAGVGSVPGVYAATAVSGTSVANENGASATGTDATAVGDGAKAYDSGSVAVGNGATVGKSTVDADTSSSVVIGDGKDDAESAHWVDLVWNGAADSTEVTRGVNSTAYGYLANASGESAVALGYSANASDNGATAVGNGTKASGSGSLAIGGQVIEPDEPGTEITYAGAEASGIRAIAIGTNSKATGLRAVALGNSTQSTGEASTALGNYTQALEKRATAVGNNAHATAQFTSALGANSEATAVGAAAVGNWTKAYGYASAAVGMAAQANSYASVALGWGAKVGSTVDADETAPADGTGMGGIAIGSYVDATNGAASVLADYGIAMGTKASIAEGATNAVAVGHGASSTVAFGLALGDSASVTHASSVAIGANSVTSEDNSVSVGASTTDTRTITNVTAGNSTKDAAIWDQLVANKTYEVGDDGTVTIETNEEVNGTKQAFKITGLGTSSSVVIGDGKDDAESAHWVDLVWNGAADSTEVTRGVNSTAYGYLANASGESAVALGYSANASDNGATAVGNGTKASGSGSLAIGGQVIEPDEPGTEITYAGAEASGIRAIAIGTNSKATGLRAVALGNSTQSTGEASTALGNYTQALEKRATAVGNNAHATAQFTSALGANSEATAVGAAAVGNWTKAYGYASAAVGMAAQANSYASVALGWGAKVGSTVDADETAPADGTGMGGIAIGSYVDATNGAASVLADYGIAMGTKASIAEGATNAVAVGHGASSTVAFGLALGDSASVTHASSVAIGANSVTSEDNSVSVGASTTDTRTITNVTAGNSTKDAAIWDQLVANKTYEVGDDGTVTIETNEEVNGTKQAFKITGIGTSTSVVIGDGKDDAESSHWVDLVWNGKADDETVTRGVNSTAYGWQANASEEAATALGYNAKASAKDSVAIGSNSEATEENVVSIGSTASTRKIVNVTAGANETDAANYGQLAKNDTYELGEDGIITVATNKEGGTAFKLKISGEGTITSGDQKLITGDTAYQELRPVTSHYYVSEDATTAANLSALDKAVYEHTRIVRVSDDFDNKILVGNDDLYANVDTISVASKASENRTIEGVKNATGTSQAATWDQIAKANQKIQLGQADGNLTLVDNDGNTIADFTVTEGDILENNAGLITGGKAYSELRPVTSTNYVAANNTTAQNLSALDSAIGVTEAGHYISAQKSTKDDATVNVATNLKELDDALYEHSKIVRVNEDGDQILVGKDGAGETTFANVKTIDIGNGATRTLTGVTAGTQETDAANYGQLAKNGTYELDADGIITVATNKEGGEAFKLKISGNGAIAKDDTGLINGNTAYEYLSPTDGNYVKAGGVDGNTTAQNLNALDTKIGAEQAGNYYASNADVESKLKALDDKIGEAIGVDGVYEATDSVETQISKVAQYTIKGDQTVSFTNTTAGDAAQSNVIRNAAGDVLVTFEQGEVEKDNAKMVSGGQVWNKDVKEGQTIELGKDGGKLTLESNEGTTLATFDVTTGAIEANNAGLLTGGTAYDELRPTTGNYISDQATKLNLSALDTKIGAAKGLDGIYGADEDVETQIYKVGQASIKGDQTVSFTNTTAGDAAQSNVIRNAAGDVLVTFEQGEVEKDNAKMVSGGQVWANDVAKNQSFTVKVGDSADILDNSDQSVAKLTFTGMQSVATGDTGFVSGGDLYNENRAEITSTNYIAQGNTAGMNLSLLDEAIGNVSKIVRVNENDGSQILVGRGDDYTAVKTIDVSNGDENYRKITGVAAGTGNNDAANYGQLASYNNGTPYTMDESGVITVKTNAQGDAFKLKISGEGVIEKDNTGLISGGTAYTELRPTDGTYVKQAETTATNLKALDTKIGEEQTGYYYTDAKSSVETKLKALDTKIGEAKGLDGVYEAGDTVETQIYKVGQARIKSDQYVSFENTTGGATNQSNVIKDAAGNTLVTFEQGAVEANNNKMVSGGQVWNNDVKNKDYELGTDGYFTVENNEGSQAFRLKLSGNGAIAENNTGLITGGTAYTYLNPTGGTVVQSGATTAANLEALDNALAKVGTYTVTDGQVTVKNNADGTAFTITGIGSGDSTIVRVNSEDNSQILVGRSTADVDYSTVKTIDVSNGGTAYRKITGVAAGEINTDAANRGQLAADSTYTLGTDGIITVKTNAGGDAFKLKISGDGAIANGNTSLITGGTAYTYLNPTSGAVVQSGATTAANLNALDNALVQKGEYEVVDGKVTVLNNADGTAFTITGIGSGDSTIVRVNSEDNSQILVGRSTADVDYSAVKTIDVSNGGENHRKITGVAAGEINTDAANYGQLASNNAGNAYEMDENGVITVKTNANGDAFKLKITDAGEVAANNKGFVTGGQVYDYVSPTTDGTYVKTGASQTTAANLKALDAKIGAEIGVDGVYEATDTVETQISKVAQARIKGDQTVSFESGKNVITDAAGNTLVTFEQGEVAKDNAKMVSGGQVWNNDVSDNNGTAYEMDTNGVITVNKNDATEAFKLKISGNGVIEENNAGLITGGTAYTYLNPTSGAVVQSGATTAENLKALDDALVQKDGSFAVDADGNVTVKNNADGTAFTITGLSTADSKIVRVSDEDPTQILVGRGDDYAAVKTIDVSNGGENHRKITGVAAGEINTDAANYGQLVKNDTYEMGEDGTITVATNKDGGEAFKLKISGNGTIAADNTGLITGGTAYTELRPATDGTYVKTAETTATNLKALDTKIGEEQAGYYYTDAKSSVETKLKALDTKIGEAKGLDGVYEAGDSIETQIYNVAQARIKGDQTVSFESGKNVIKDAAGNTLVTFEQGAVEANNNKMVSGGQVWNNDVKNKDYELGTDGYFTVENNEGSQAFRLKLSGNGAIAENNTGLITGGTAYTYLNPTGGTVVQSGATTAANLEALDNALAKVGTYTVADGQVVVKNNKGEAAFTITGIGTGSGDSTIVRLGSDDPSQILIGRSTDSVDYSDVKTIDVSNGGENYRKITGVADGSSNHDAANYGQLLAIQNYEAKDGTLTLKTNAGTEFQITGLGSGSGTEYTAGDGISITDNTISANVGDGLQLSDSKITAKVDDDTIKVKDGALYVNANGTVADGDSGLVTGGDVWTAIQNHTTPVEGVSVEDVFNYKPGVGQYYAKKDLTLSQDIEALDTGLNTAYKQLIKIQDYAASDGTVTLETNGGQTFKITGLGSGSGSGATYTAGDGITISNNKISVNADGKVESGNSGIVTGGKVYDAILEKTGDTTKLAEAGLGDNLTDSVLTVNNKINGFTDDINKVGAGAAALAALHPEAFDPSDKLSFAIGYGHYRNANATAIGAFYKPNYDTTISIGGTLGNGDPMMNLGVSFKVGKRSKGLGLYSSNADLVREVNSLRADNSDLKNNNLEQGRVINEQAKKIASLQSDNEQMKRQIQLILSRMEMSDQVTKSAAK